MKRAFGDRSAKLSIMVILVVVVVIIALVAVPFLFLQYRTVSINEERTVPLAEGADRLDLNVTATVGHLNVQFASLGGPALKVLANVTGHSGFFGEESPLELVLSTWNDTAVGGRSMNVSIGFDTYAPWPYYSLTDTFYTVQIEQSLRSDLNLSVITGGVRLTTQAGVVLEGLRLNATNDGAVVSLNNGTVLAGDVHIRTATGGTRLSWNNLTVQGDRALTIAESSGRINARFEQALPMGDNLTIKTKDTVGETTMMFSLRGDVAALIECNGGIGGVALTPAEGFSGPATAFLSDNYPANSHLNAQLNDTIGSIMVGGRWVP